MKSLEPVAPVENTPAQPAVLLGGGGDINPDRGHIPALDGVRGLAVLMVMGFHFFQREDFRSGIGRVITTAANVGQSGVNLFFVLSGFLITGILLHEKNSPHFFRNFYGRRILRIFPLYYLALAVCYFVLDPMSGLGVPPVTHQLWGWFYLINIQNLVQPHHQLQPSHFWSLAVEEHFYLLWPALVYFTSRRGLYIAGIFCVAESVILRPIIARMNLDFFSFTLTQLDPIATGALLAVFVRHRKGFGRLRPFHPKLCLLASILMMMPLWFAMKGARSQFNITFKPLLLALMYCSLIASLLASGPGLLKNLFSSRVLRWFGKYSYGLYVWDGIIHIAGGSWLTGGNWYSKATVGVHIHNPALLIFCCAAMQFSISIVFAYLSWNLFEKQFLRFKKYFAHTQKSIPTASPFAESPAA